MTRFLLILGPVSLTSGCIIYDNVGKCGRGDQTCTWDEDSASADTSGLGVGDTGETGEEAPAAVFLLDPNEATAGETVIASLTAENFDLGRVTHVESYGAATVTASALRPDELLLTVAADAGAAEGETMDLLLEVGDDEAQFLPAIFTVHAQSGGGNGGTDTGCN